MDSGPAELKCRKCREGSFSKNKNSLECTRCPETLISKEGSTKCESCPPGKGNVDFDGVCKPCDFFQFNDGSEDFCQRCPDGFWGNSKVGSTKYVPCPAGTVGNRERCEKCKPGENTFFTGATFCAPENTPCASNLFRNSRGACQRCEKSERYNKSKQKCEPCGKNEVSKGGIDTKCTKCPPDEILNTMDFGWAMNPGQQCVCKFGWARQPEGKCKKCPAGYFRDGGFRRGDDSQGNACLQCSLGSFSPRAGTPSCLKCSEGKLQPLRGQTKCLACPPGLVSSKFRDRCVDPATGCEKGEKRVKVGGDAVCRGKEEDSKNRPPCSFFERFVPKRNECVSCPFGAGSEGGKSTKCEKCDGIFWAVGFGCQCVAGFFAARELVNGQCRTCQAGTFGRNGVPGCQMCPAGTFRKKDSGAADECEYCGPGTFSNPGAGKCTRCPKGTNSYGFGNAKCVILGSLK